MKVRIIANPVAGGGRGKDLAEALCRALEGKVADVELVLTQKAGDNKIEAGKPGADCVVAVGGDGSVNEVVNGLGDTGAILAILPSGTANVVARELSLPHEPEALATLIAKEQMRWMDVGRCGEHRFMLGAGAGLDAAITLAVSGQRGKKSSLSKWVGPTVKTVFSYSYPRFRVVADDKIVSENAQYAIVGNCRYSAGVFPATPIAKIDDGLLDVCVMENLSLLHLASILATVWHPAHIRRKDILYVQCSSVSFEAVSDERVPLQVDGDPWGDLPASFDVVPKAIQVIAPAPS